MNDLLNSPIFENLKNGKLPTVEVSVSQTTILSLTASVFLAIVAALLVAQIIKDLK